MITDNDLFLFDCIISLSFKSDLFTRRLMNHTDDKIEVKVQ